MTTKHYETNEAAEIHMMSHLNEQAPTSFEEEEHHTTTSFQECHRGSTGCFLMANDTAISEMGTVSRASKSPIQETSDRSGAEA